MPALRLLGANPLGQRVEPFGRLRQSRVCRQHLAPFLRRICAETKAYRRANRVMHLFGGSIYTFPGVYSTLAVNHERLPD